jgi:chloramphenicol 3-O-phosphotransferase
VWYADAPGQIIIFNGTPRSENSNIAAAIQNTFDWVRMNLGVDRFKQLVSRRRGRSVGNGPRSCSSATQPGIAHRTLAGRRMASSASRSIADSDVA